MQLDIWVWNWKDMLALEANMEAIGPSIVSEVWEKLTSARVLTRVMRGNLDYTIMLKFQVWGQKWGGKEGSDPGVKIWNKELLGS